MASEIIIITGETQSGKTYFAEAISKSWNGTCKIYDEPEINRNFKKEIKLFTAYHGRVIITCIDAIPYLAKLKVDKLITIKQL